MTRDEKAAWMAVWAAKNKCRLELEGEVGFGRECVGIISGDSYPDYPDDDAMPIPEDAYHKHNCVAVLGRGENAEAQLFDWLRWFDANGYTVSAELDMGEGSEFARMKSQGNTALALLMGKHNSVKMVKRAAVTP